MDEFRIVFPRNYDYRTRNNVAYRLSCALTPSGLYHNAVDVLYDASHSIFESEKLRMQFIFDLGATRYIDLASLAELISLGRFCHFSTDKKVRVILPNSERVIRSFMLPWNFFEFFYQWAEPISPIKEVSAITSLRSCIPLQNIQKLADVRATIDTLKKPRLLRTLRQNLGLTEDDRNLLVDKIIAEICDNIPNHSFSEGVIGAQIHSPNPYGINDLPKGYEPNVDIVVSDAGIGILQSLRTKHPSVYDSKSSGEALDDVLNGKTPPTPGRNRGGIARMRQYVEQLRGIFEIRIPFATGTFKYNRSTITPFSMFFPGTHVTVKIPCSAIKLTSP